MEIEARLDLHGLSQDRAHEALCRFIEQSIISNRRCVLIITGKGKARATSEEWLTPGQGILKEKTPQWLATMPHKKEILKIYPAQPKHGGSGALYVYLKKQR